MPGLPAALFAPLTPPQTFLRSFSDSRYLFSCRSRRWMARLDVAIWAISLVLRCFDDLLTSHDIKKIFFKGVDSVRPSCYDVHVNRKDTHDRPIQARQARPTEPLQAHRRSTHGRTSQRWRPAADIVVYPDLVRDESRAGSTGQAAEKDNFRLRQVAVGKSPIGTGAGAGIASRFSLEKVCTRHPIMHSNSCTLTTVTQPIAPSLPCRPRMEAAADRIMYGPTEARQPMGRSGRILAKRLGIDAMRLNCSLRANCAHTITTT